jgi:hypothetical protein
MILALDIATTMGFAIGELGAEPVSGSIRFGSKDASLWAKYNHVLRWAIDRFKQPDGPRVTRLVIEDQLNPQAFSSKEGADLLYGFPAIIAAVAYECGIYQIHRRKVADVRGLFIGRRGLKTNDAKFAVMRRCKQLGWEAVDDNAADALALWAYECSLLDHRAVLNRLARCAA